MASEIEKLIREQMGDQVWEQVKKELVNEKKLVALLFLYAGHMTRVVEEEGADKLEGYTYIRETIQKWCSDLEITYKDALLPPRVVSYLEEND